MGGLWQCFTHIIRAMVIPSSTLAGCSRIPSWKATCVRRPEKEESSDSLSALAGTIGNLCIYVYIPVVPHKAVAEVSIVGNYSKGELL